MDLNNNCSNYLLGILQFVILNAPIKILLRHCKVFSPTRIFNTTGWQAAITTKNGSNFACSYLKVWSKNKFKVFIFVTGFEKSWLPRTFINV